MYQTLATPLSQVAARRVCLPSGISASSMYSSTLNVQAVTVAIEVSVPSNLSGFVISIEGSVGCTNGSLAGSGSGRIDCSICLWGASGCLWGCTGVTVTAPGVRPRARNSLESGILTLATNFPSLLKKKRKVARTRRFNRTKVERLVGIVISRPCKEISTLPSI